MIFISSILYCCVCFSVCDNAEEKNVVLAPSPKRESTNKNNMVVLRFANVDGIKMNMKMTGVIIPTTRKKVTQSMKDIQNNNNMKQAQNNIFTNDITGQSKGTSFQQKNNYNTTSGKVITKNKNSLLDDIKIRIEDDKANLNDRTEIQVELNPDEFQDLSKRPALIQKVKALIQDAIGSKQNGDFKPSETNSSQQPNTVVSKANNLPANSNPIGVNSSKTFESRANNLPLNSTASGTNPLETIASKENNLPTNSAPSAYPSKSFGSKGSNLPAKLTPLSAKPSKLKPIPPAAQNLQVSKPIKNISTNKLIERQKVILAKKAAALEKMAKLANKNLLEIQRMEQETSKQRNLLEQSNIQPSSSSKETTKNPKNVALNGVKYIKKPDSLPENDGLSLFDNIFHNEEKIAHQKENIQPALTFQHTQPQKQPSNPTNLKSNMTFVVHTATIAPTPASTTTKMISTTPATTTLATTTIATTFATTKATTTVLPTASPSSTAVVSNDEQFKLEQSLATISSEVKLPDYVTQSSSSNVKSESKSETQNESKAKSGPADSSIQSSNSLSSIDLPNKDIQKYFQKGNKKKKKIKILILNDDEETPQFVSNNKKLHMIHTDTDRIFGAERAFRKNLCSGAYYSCIEDIDQNHHNIESPGEENLPPNIDRSSDHETDFLKRYNEKPYFDDNLDKSDSKTVDNLIHMDENEVQKIMDFDWQNAEEVSPKKQLLDSYTGEENSYLKESKSQPDLDLYFYKRNRELQWKKKEKKDQHK